MSEREQWECDLEDKFLNQNVMFQTITHKTVYGKVNRIGVTIQSSQLVAQIMIGHELYAMDKEHLQDNLIIL